MEKSKTKSKGFRLAISSKKNSNPSYNSFVPPKPIEEDDKKKKNNLDRLQDDVVMFSKLFQMRLKGGTLDGMIKKLLQISTVEEDIAAFLFGYPSLTTIDVLLEKLFISFEPPRKKDEELMKAIEKKEFEENVKMSRIQ